ncbi:MAG TPA: hypothetical protein VFK86_04145 [Bauldia sp.]|nr:hypothetical protein [Bauldia sp.]
MIEIDIRRYLIHGHAIVSADDRIAEASGLTPASLKNEADWRRFQAALDRAAVTVLGRLGHEAHPNAKGRNRLVLSSAVRGVERRRDAWWWNPAQSTLAEALRRAAPEGGIVAVPGGMRVFDYFLSVGYDEFHLSRALGVDIPGGVPLFSAVDRGITADTILATHGLKPVTTGMLDAAALVSLTVWQRPT